jgi:hypothetical protein
MRLRERVMRRFKCMPSAQRFLAAFSRFCNHFRVPRHRLTAAEYRALGAPDIRVGATSRAPRRSAQPSQPGRAAQLGAASVILTMPAGEVPAAKDARALARFFTMALQGRRVAAKATPDRAVLRDMIAVTLATLD